jgi:hypothetical protein
MISLHHEDVFLSYIRKTSKIGVFVFLCFCVFVFGQEAQNVVQKLE